MTARVGYYADDFTGATDTLAVAVRAGLRALLFLHVPSPDELARAGELDVVGIAGTARSLRPDAMAAELEPALRRFAELGIPVVHYKCCSTFDSAPDVGSIGAAIRLARGFQPNAMVAIVGGQPQLGRYCLFGNLFAAAGAGGDVFRIDRHPTMSVHPVTPMREGDLRRHLAHQGLGRIESLPYTAYAWAPPALDQRVEHLVGSRPDAVLFDVSRDEDLGVIGRILSAHAARERLLAVGPSSVVQGLAAHWGAAPAPPRPVAPASGPVFVIAGSLSPVTAAQVAAARSYVKVPLDALRLADADPAYLDAAAAAVAAELRLGRHILASTADGMRAEGRARDVASGCGALLSRVLPLVKLRRIGVAGGDTSSLAASALGITALGYAGDLGHGVALCRAHAPGRPLDGLEVMLKGGQMGATDVLERLVAGSPVRI